MNRIDQKRMLEGCLYNAQFNDRKPPAELLDLIQQVKEMARKAGYCFVADEYRRIEVHERNDARRPVAVLLSI